MDKFHKVKVHSARIYNDDQDHPMKTLVEVDGHAVKGIRSIEYSASYECAPEFKFVTYGIPDIKIDGARVILDCSPANVNQAAVVLRNALANDQAMYDAWVSSITACIDNSHEVTVSGMARCIVDWLVGEDLGGIDD